MKGIRLREATPARRDLSLAANPRDDGRMVMTLDLRQVRYFVALYEERSITRAAERLHVVQPAVSMQIRKLEADYGLPLFDRTSQGVLPNDDADRLYAHCLDIVERFEVAHEFLTTATGRVFGNLVIGIPPSLAMGLMPRLVVRYAEMYPEVNVRLIEAYSATILEKIEEGSVDVGLVSGHAGAHDSRSRTIADDELVLVIANDEACSSRPEMSGEEVARLKLVLPSNPNQIRKLIDQAFLARNLHLTPAMEVDSLTTVIGLVRSGHFATILPSHSLIGVEEAFGLKGVRMIDPQIRRTLTAILPARRLATRAAESFIGMLIEEIDASFAPEKRPLARAV